MTTYFVIGAVVALLFAMGATYFEAEDRAKRNKNRGIPMKNLLETMAVSGAVLFAWPLFLVILALYACMAVAEHYGDKAGSKS